MTQYAECLDKEHDITYYEAYDNEFCNTCSKWLIAKCGNDHCWFCPTMPDDPRK